MAKKRFDPDRPLPRPDPVHDRPTHPTDPDRIQVGHILSIYSYARVVAVDLARETLLVEDLLHGGTFDVDGRTMMAATASADDYAETVRVSQTQLAQILITTSGRPFTADYVKLDGQERVLRGYFLRHEEMFGRSLCLDLDLYLDVTRKKQEFERKQAAGEDPGEPVKDDYLRLVDHRTLRSLIVGGVRFLPR